MPGYAGSLERFKKFPMVGKDAQVKNMIFLKEEIPSANHYAPPFIYFAISLSMAGFPVRAIERFF